MIDYNQPIKANVRTENGIVPIELKFPSDEQWSARQARRKLIIRSTSRGEETIAPKPGDEDKDLVDVLRVDSATVEIDPYVAARILDYLGRAEVEDVIYDGDQYRIEIRVAGGNVTFIARRPTARELDRFKRSFGKSIDLPHNKRQVTLNLDAAAELYKAIEIKVEGYGGPPPIIHKAAAIQAIVEAIEQGFASDEPETF